MKISRKLLPLLLIIPALLACNLSTLAGVGPSSPAPSGNTPAAPASQEQIQALNEEENQVREAVTGFLTALQTDPNNAGAQAFLSQNLQQQVSAGTSPATLGGLQGTVPAFELSAVTFAPDAGRAFVDASLLYTAPLNTRFELVKTGEGWKIDSITSQQGEAGYPSSPEMVVQTFLTAYQEAPDQMNQFLSASRLQQLPPGGAVGMLNINGSLEGSMIDSAAVNPDPPMAAITVTMRVGGQDTTRVFSLIKEDGRWKITNID
jgi:hypothetical protein